MFLLCQLLETCLVCVCYAVLQRLRIDLVGKKTFGWMFTLINDSNLKLKYETHLLVKTQFYVSCSAKRRENIYVLGGHGVTLHPTHVATALFKLQLQLSLHVFPLKSLRCRWRSLILTTT